MESRKEGKPKEENLHGWSLANGGSSSRDSFCQGCKTYIALAETSNQVQESSATGV